MSAVVCVSCGTAQDAADPARCAECGSTMFTEKVSSAGKRGKLPEDFPGRAALADAGVDTYGKARKVVDFTVIPGIGEATGAKIVAALGIDDGGDE